MWPWKVASRLEIMDTKHLEHNRHSIIAISKNYLSFLVAVGYPNWFHDAFVLQGNLVLSGLPTFLWVVYIMSSQESVQELFFYQEWLSSVVSFPDLPHFFEVLYFKFVPPQWESSAELDMIPASESSCIWSLLLSPCHKFPCFLRMPPAESP